MNWKITSTATGIVVVGAIAAAGCSWYTAQKMDEYLQYGLENLNRSPVMRASWYPQSSSFFSRNGVLHLVILNQHMRKNVDVGPVDSDDPRSLQRTKERMAEPLPRSDEEPLELFINVSNNMFPFMVRGHATLDMSRGTLSELVQQKAIPATLPLSMTWRFTAPTRSFSLKAGMDRWSVQQPTQKVEVAPADLSIDGDISDGGELRYAWQGLKTTANQPSADKLEVLPLEGHSLLRNFSGIWIMPETRFELKGINVSTAGSKLDMAGLNINATMFETPSESGSTLNTKHEISLAKLHISTQQTQFNLDALSLGLSFSGVNKQGLEELAQESRADKPDFMQMMKSMNKVTTRSLRLDLAPCNLMLNQGRVNAYGHLETLPFEVEQLIRATAANTPDPFKYMLQGELTVSAETKAVATLPPAVRQELSTLQQQGFVKTDDKGISSHLQLIAGSLTANGKPLNF